VAPERVVEAVLELLRPVSAPGGGVSAAADADADPDPDPDAAADPRADARALDASAG
jgi:hypothetical protein